VENNVVYVVIISGEWGEDMGIHSIYSSEPTAEKVRQEIESNLSEDMIVYVEQHELND
jgi:hypothetical protein